MIELSVMTDRSSLRMQYDVATPTYSLLSRGHATAVPVSRAGDLSARSPVSSVVNQERVNKTAVRLIYD